MDRNHCRCYPCNTCYRVALRKESVDRNRNSQYSYFLYYGSLSARRAWIEIRRFLASWSAVLVALRKESVDRNMPSHWITSRTGGVALRKESVDRNAACTAIASKSDTVALRKESVDRNANPVLNA